MKLTQIVPFEEVLQWPEGSDQRLTRIHLNSKNSFERGSLFVAKKGSHRDSHHFVVEAFSRGATWAAVDNKALVPTEFESRLLVVKDCTKLLSRLAQNFYQNPSASLFSVGVTGTNGKTSVAYLVEHLLTSAGKVCGVLGTIDHHLRDRIWATELTTPDSLTLHGRLKEMLDLGAQCCVLEISSHALDQRRAEGLELDAAIFTNLSQDHLDYHKDIQDYFGAKEKLFTEILSSSRKNKKWAIINQDDSFARTIKMSQQFKVVSFGFSPESDYRCRVVDQNLLGTHFEINTKTDELLSFWTSMIGIHNVLNASAALSLCLELKLETALLVKSLASFKGVPGRLERVESDQGIIVFVDYAHTPDALEKVLETLHHLKQTVESDAPQLLTVFGCGGDRDRSKRPLMARAVEKFSDRVIVTSDNPRSEDPSQIIDEIERGFSTQFRHSGVVHREIDRRKAIASALQLAKKGDVILIAGKGHECTQVIGDQTLLFSDVSTVKELLNELYTPIK